MPRITYVSFDGKEYVVTVESGLSAMEGAVHNNVPGIDADCGGNAACGTCHVHVDSAWLGKTGKAHEGTEKDMLACTDDVSENSRLACQIAITDEMDGLILRMPKRQH